MAAGLPRPELLALLRAVKAEPDDDTVKLALADWLQEQDDEADRARGEYVRAVTEYQRSIREARPGLSYYQRFSALWEQHHFSWVDTLAQAGFQFVECDPHVPPLFSSLIGGTQVMTRKTQLMARSEAYAWVGGLSFHRISAPQLTNFADSPLLDSLILLHFRGCNATAASFATLVNSPRARSLKRLDFYEQNDVPTEAIASSPQVSRLRELQLWRTGLTDTGFKTLCDSPHLNDLRLLVVAGNSLTIHSARAFVDGTGLPKLTELNLGGTNRIGPDGTLIMVASPNTGRLRKLNLWANGIADYGVEAICRQTHMCNLTHLDVSGNLLTNRAAVALAAAEHLGTLEELNLGSNAISGEGALALANSPHLTNLHQLDLTVNNIGEKAADALRERFGDRVVL